MLDRVLNTSLATVKIVLSHLFEKRITQYSGEEGIALEYQGWKKATIFSWFVFFHDIVIKLNYASRKIRIQIDCIVDVF